MQQRNSTQGNAQQQPRRRNLTLRLALATRILVSVRTAVTDGRRARALPQFPPGVSDFRSARHPHRSMRPSLRLTVDRVDVDVTPALPHRLGPGCDVRTERIGTYLLWMALALCLYVSA